ncbi:MAG: glycosyltransferase [Candidatus Dojkabacteria bacterium]|nr:glycosyltransferase [Candidatus Dojkabacteria bacterium]
MKIQIYGPYYTSYSLAKINRNLALALDKFARSNNLDVQVTLWCSEDDIDYYPTSTELQNVKYRHLVKNEESPDISIYNNFPKNFYSNLGLSKLAGKIKFMYLAWEESVYPERWVKEINQYLDGIFVTSTFVKKILLNSGVRIPIFVVHPGVDDILEFESKNFFNLKSDKYFKILHISSLKKRKGVDVLLQAYIETFKSTDDVVLIIKTFLNRDNTELISYVRHLQKFDQNPQIELIIEDLTDAQIASLHSIADIEVYPSRAEGFGYPQIESMLFYNPVVVTEYSAYLDFLNQDNAFLLDYKITDAVQSEFPNIGAKWAEPNKDDLCRILKYLYSNARQIKEDKQSILLGDHTNLSMFGKNLIRAYLEAKKFTWENTASQFYSILSSFFKICASNLSDSSLAIISTYNDDSGISEYTRTIYSFARKFFKNLYFLSNRDTILLNQQDEDNVHRLWNIKDNNVDKIVDFVLSNNVKSIHLQFHSAQMSIQFVNSLLDLLPNNVDVYITFHNLKVNNINFAKEITNINRFKKIFVHNSSDVNYLKDFYPVDRIVVHHLPVKEFAVFGISKLKEYLGLNNRYPIILTHGFLNTNKNIQQIIQVVEILKEQYPNVLFISLSAVSDSNILASKVLNDLYDYTVRKKLENNVLIVPQFLNDYEIIYFAHISDLFLLNYSDVGESASAALNKIINAKKPIIVTDIRTFYDFKEQVLKISSPYDYNAMLDKIQQVLHNQNLQKELANSLEIFAKQNTSEKIMLKVIESYM